MFERYTDDARKVLSRARQEAQKFRHDHLGTEHILLGLIEVKHCVAAQILLHWKINLGEVKKQVNELVSHNAGPEDGDYETLPRTECAQGLLDDAAKEARELKHKYIGSEHLLLGLLYENEGVGAQVLQNLGLKLEDVRDDALEFLANMTITDSED